MTDKGTHFAYCSIEANEYSTGDDRMADADFDNVRNPDDGDNIDVVEAVAGGDA